MFYEEKYHQNNISLLIENFQDCSRDLIEYLNANTDVLDPAESEQLKRLDLLISDAFDKLIHFDRENLWCSILKLEYLVDEISMESNAGLVKEKALSSVISDIKQSYRIAPEQNYIEKRKSFRKQLNIFGASVRASKFTSNCVIRNATKDGVCLIVENAGGLPKTFELISQNGLNAIEMTKIWRNDNEIGGIITRGKLDLSAHL